MYIGEPFSWKPAAFEGSNGIMSVTTKETTAKRARLLYRGEGRLHMPELRVAEQGGLTDG